ncbi:MAG: oligosaccharide flippase family protein [Alphaproteobacteria bacterium]|nr:oligosaccharide flippase family protein [Alphaproteobacteria bacterium]
MAKTRISLNVATAFLEILANSVILFFLYRFLLDEVGIAMIGVWSLVLATTAFGNLAGFGFPRSLIYFLPGLLRRKKQNTAVLYIETALLCISGFITLLCLLLYYPLYYVLGVVIDAGAELDVARELLPWALLSLILFNISDILLSSIRGLQLNYLASFAIMLGAGLYFAIALVLVPDYGIIAMAWAQVAQVCALIIIAFVTLKIHLPLPYIPKRLSKKTFSKIASYGFKAQYIAFIVMFFQPLTKFYLGAYSTLEMVGYYEFALKFVQNVGKMITNANNALISTFSLFNNDKSKTKELFLKSNSVTWLVAPSMMGGLLAISPAISVLWIGEYVEAFFYFTLIIGLANTFSVMCSPSYSMGMGAGMLRGNIIGQTIISLANALLGWTLGSLLGAYGVVIGSASALILGNIYIMYYSSSKIIHGRPFTMSIALRTIALTSIMLLAIFACYSVFHNAGSGENLLMLFIKLSAVYCALLLLPALMHPGFNVIVSGIFRKRVTHAE